MDNAKVLKILDDLKAAILAPTPQSQIVPNYPTFPSTLAPQSSPLDHVKKEIQKLESSGFFTGKFSDEERAIADEIECAFRVAKAATEALDSVLDKYADHPKFREPIACAETGDYGDLGDLAEEISNSFEVFEDEIAQYR